MNELIEYIGKQPKEVILYIIFKLMQDGKIDFVDITKVHVEHLEEMRKGQTEKLISLRSKVIGLWCGKKQDIGKNLVALIQEGKNDGWVNITQEKIDNSKWNHKCR